MEYQNLLIKADQEDDPVMRMIYVSLFNVAQYNSTSGRLSKPFNPLLGETFELKTKDFNFFSE